MVVAGLEALGLQKIVNEGVVASFDQPVWHREGGCRCCLVRGSIPMVQLLRTACHDAFTCNLVSSNSAFMDESP